MKQISLIAFVSTVAIIIAATSYPVAQSPNDDRPQLPHGWTEADMQAIAKAGTPGPMHEHLRKAVGTWDVETTVWMAPGSDPITGDGTASYSPMMNGRYVKFEITGELSGMGGFHGQAIYGYDNSAERFQCAAIDSHSTRILNGTGQLSSDGTKLEWEFTFTCPITKKPAVKRDVERITSDDTRLLETFATDPKTGEEYRMMKAVFTRNSD